jgi:hypothetical protein
MRLDASPLSRRLFISLASVAPLLPREAIAVGAGTSVTGKSRPELGCVLIDEVTQTGKTVTAELALRGTGSQGVAATATFDSPWPLARGLYYDVEAKNEKGSVFLQVVPLPSEESVMTAPKKLFTKNILKVDGRFGSYGAPTDIKITADEVSGERRRVDFGFTTTAPGGADVNWKATLAALQPRGSPDALVIVSGAPVGKWKDGGEALSRSATSSFRIAQVRPTSIPPVASSDVRFERLGGLLSDEQRKGVADSKI